MNFFFKFQNLSTSLYSTNFYSLFMIVRGVQNLALRFFKKKPLKHIIPLNQYTFAGT